MTTVTYKEGETITLEISGHSGSAPFGRDLICAAVTILARTFIASTQAESEIRSGYLFARCGFDKRREARAIVQGFLILARQYPGNVKMAE